MKKKSIFLLLIQAFFFNYSNAQVEMTPTNLYTVTVGTPMKPPPAPVLSIKINGRYGGDIDSTEFLSWSYIQVISNDSLTGIDSTSYHVKSYSCIVQSNSGARSFIIQDSKITERVIDAIKHCKPKDLIILYNIIIIDDKGVQKTIKNGPSFRIN